MCLFVASVAPCQILTIIVSDLCDAAVYFLCLYAAGNGKVAAINQLGCVIQTSS